MTEKVDSEPEPLDINVPDSIHAMAKRIRHKRDELGSMFDCCDAEEGSPPCEDAITFTSLLDNIALTAIQIGFNLGAIRGPKGEISEDEVMYLAYGLDIDDDEEEPGDG
jgi:hypothetical protein